MLILNMAGTTEYSPIPSSNALENHYEVKQDLRNMSADELFHYIVDVLKPAEDHKYKTGNTAEHKLLFLVGGPENDVSVARTSDGKTVYSIPPDHPKLPEVSEANAAISRYFEHDKESLPSVMSEIADIYFNLAILTEVDQDEELNYRKSMDHLTIALGITLRGGLLLAATKYKIRLLDGGEKDLQGEEEAMADLISANGRAPHVSISEDGLKAGYRALNEISHFVLKPRVVQIAGTNSWSRI